MSWSAVSSVPDELGESPFWHPLEQMLYWIDIPGRQVRRINVFNGQMQSWAMAQEPGCIAPARSGGLVIALRDGIYRAREWGGALTPLSPAGYDTATMRFNDGKCDPLGRFWAGTMYEPRDARRAELYAMDCRGGCKPKVQSMLQDAILANGLAWSPDARTMYWSDTVDHVVHAWDWDAHANLLSGKRVFQQFAPKPAGWQLGMPYGGRPDGASVDSQGNYWVAMFEGGRLLQLSPDGALLADIATPAQCPTMPCFGGDDLRTLYITTARRNRPPQELAVQPLAGSVFSMRVDVPGLPVNFFED